MIVGPLSLLILILAAICCVVGGKLILAADRDSEPEPTVFVCTRCRRINRQAARFCSQCGWQLVSTIG